MEQDLKEKRARFIQNAMEINQEFECLPPASKLKMSQLYNEHYTGSCCWNFSDEIFDQLVNSFNVNVRVIHVIPRNSHRWIVEELVEGKHARKIIYSRYIKFVNSLLSTERQCVRFLFKYVSAVVTWGHRWGPTWGGSNLIRMYQSYRSYETSGFEELQGLQYPWRRWTQDGNSPFIDCDPRRPLHSSL